MKKRPDAQTLVVAMSSRALFNLEDENRIYEQLGVESYAAYQRKHENDVLKPGAGFALAKALLALNSLSGDRVAEIIIMSHNSYDTSLRIFNSIQHYGLDITRGIFTNGKPVAPYISAFKTDLLLSCDYADVQAGINGGIASGLICAHSAQPSKEIDCIRIAFDGDCVLFGGESEAIYQAHGADEFDENERQNRDVPLSEGPFAPFLRTLSALQTRYPDAPIRTALITARSAPAHERVVKTLRRWNVRIDEAFFMGGLDKSAVLAAFGADIFFDDSTHNIASAATVVPSAQVPGKAQ